MAYRKKVAGTADKTTETKSVKSTVKATAKDVVKNTGKSVVVELNSAFACDLNGIHRVYKSYGNFTFRDGKATVSAGAAELLKKDLVIK